jgi:alginate O-acetyltransferase complex protein AlgI
MSMVSLVLVLGCLAVGAFLAEGGVLRRRLAVALVVPGLAAPFAFQEESSLVRGVAALGAFWGLVRLQDLYGESPSRPLRYRLWHELAGFDTRTVTRAQRRLDLPRMCAGLAYAALAALGLWCVLAGARYEGVAYALCRYVGGAVFIYAMADAVHAMVRASYLAVGLVVPSFHEVPIASRTLAEFWGDRWNRIVSAWLRTHFFLPLARRGRAGAGSLLAFFMSALLHAYLALVVGVAMAAVMGAFFLIQGLLVHLERVAGIRRWPLAVARVWTVVALFASSPLFVEPMLRIVLGE